MVDYSVELYQKIPQIVLGFHGCDKSVALDVLNSNDKQLKASTNKYDWLGEGVYFWLNDPQRGYEWAVQTHERDPKKISEPYVLGAVIDLGNCLNFCERNSVLLLQKAYKELDSMMQSSGLALKENKVPDAGGFSLIRPLDCAVISHLHTMMEKVGVSFDTVYGYFQEGEEAFPGAGIREKSHVQICVRNLSCIKGYFIPKKIVNKH